jgi:uncharacterized protein YndB with AHSA1/START domain
VTQAEQQEIVLTRTYPDPVEDVWSAFTDSERLGRWYGTYTGTGRPGGTVEVTVTGEVDAGGEIAGPDPVRIHECAPPHRLAVEIPETDSRSWFVTVDLTSVGSGTELVFTQRLVAGISAADVEAGWSWYLDRLGASLRGGEMPDWSDYAPR